MYSAKSEGFHYKCVACGQCCRHVEGSGVYLFPEDIRTITRKLCITKRDFILRYCLLSDNVFTFQDQSIRVKYLELNLVYSGVCPLLEFGRCSVHSAKPLGCKHGPFLYPLKNDRVAWDRFCETCQGMGSGPFVSNNTFDRVALENERLHDSYYNRYLVKRDVWPIYCIEKVDIPILKRIKKFYCNYTAALQSSKEIHTSYTEKYIKEGR